MAPTANPSLYRCPKKSIWYPDTGSQLVFTHSFIMIPEENGVFPWMQIEVPPYTIKVIRSKNSAKSVITKTVLKTKHRFDKSKNKEYVAEEILTIDAAIDLPWNDRQTVLGRIHTYLVFS